MEPDSLIFHQQLRTFVGYSHYYDTAFPNRRATNWHSCDASSESYLTQGLSLQPTVLRLGSDGHCISVCNYLSKDFVEALYLKSAACLHFLTNDGSNAKTHPYLLIFVANIQKYFQFTKNFFKKKCATI